MIAIYAIRPSRVCGSENLYFGPAVRLEPDFSFFWKDPSLAVRFDFVFALSAASNIDSKIEIGQLWTS